MRDDAELYRRGCGVVLILGPALFLLDNLLHPEEVPRGNEAEQLEAIAASFERWQLAHLIGFLALLLFAAAVLGLAYLVRARRPLLGLVAGAAGLVGSLALAFAFALDGFTWGVLGELYGRPGTDAETLQLALHEIQQSPWGLPYYGLAVLWIAGFAALALAAGQAGAIGRRAAVLLALGTLAVGLEGAIQDNAYFIASSALLLVAGVDAGRSLLRRRSADAGTGAG